MNKIATKISSKNEAIIYNGRPSWLYYYWLYIIGIALFFILTKAGNSAAGIIFLLTAFLVAAMLRYRYKFTITDEWIIMRVGLIARNTNEMQMSHIRAINIRQGIIERILGIGTIEISSAAGEGVEVKFTGIRDPHGVKERVRGLEGER